jgi:hypothetical protein
MRDLPIAAKMVVNIILYAVYLLFASVIFSFIFPLVMQIFGQDILNKNDPIFSKIQIFIAILVLLLSLILRKNFYISLKNPDYLKKVEIQKIYSNNLKTGEDTTDIKKKHKKHHKHHKHNHGPEYDNEDDEIKIYVEKEIK